MIAAFGVIAILLSALFAVRETRKSREEAAQNFALSLASASVKVLAEHPDRTREAALLAIESNRLFPSAQANLALRTAVSLLPSGVQSYQADNSDPDQRVRDLAFSPDGATLAAVRDNGSTQLMDLNDHKLIGNFLPEETPAARIDLAAASKDGSLDGDNSSNAVSVAFNSTGSQVATGVRDGFVHVWRFPGGRELLRIFHGSPVSQVAFHPKADELVTATEDGHVRIFEVARGAAMADFKVSGKIVAASFSPNGDVLAALSSDGPVSLFDPVDHKLLRTLFADCQAALAMAFSRDGKRLATAMGDFAFVWDVASGRQVLKATHAEPPEYLGTQQWIDSIAISPDGKFIAYGARGNRFAFIWNVETGHQILKLEHDSPVAAVSFNADGTKLSTGSYDGTSRVWELPSGRELERAPHAEGSEVVVFSPDGGRVAAGGMTGSISISEIRRAHSPIVFDLPGDVRSFAFSPDGRRFAIGAISARHLALVRIADTSGNIVRNIEVNGPPVLDKLFFLDPNQVLAQWSNMLFLIAIDKSLVTRLAVPDTAGDLRIDPSGKAFAIQPDEATRLYDLPGLRQTASVNGPPSGLLRTAGEGSLLAFDTSKPPGEFRIDVWSVAQKARVSRVALPAELNKVALNPAGTILFTAEGENLQAWDIPSGQRRFSVRDNSDIQLIVPDPSSAFFATLTKTHLTVWHAVNGARLAEFPAATSAVFSPDGRYLLTRSGSRSAALWLWRSSDLRAEACARLTSNLSHDEWARWFPKQAYRRTCPNLPAGN
jgi:WD40 repeat protein